jgi:hypothetical protein
MTYTIEQLPLGTKESDLYIAWWDGTQWIKLASTIDLTAKTVSAQTSHFTAFGLFAPPALPPPAPTLKINSPIEGISVDAGNITLSITTENLKLVTGNLTNNPGEGHVIYYLDVAIPTTAGKSALTAAGTCKETDTTSNTWSDLTPGTHTLGVQLVQNEGTPFSSPVFASVSITVKAVLSPISGEAAAPPESKGPRVDANTSTAGGIFVGLGIFIAAAIVAGGSFIMRHKLVLSTRNHG